MAFFLTLKPPQHSCWADFEFDKRETSKRHTVPLLHLLAWDRNTYFLLLRRDVNEGFGTSAHISPCDLSIYVGWHVSTAVLLLERSLIRAQPLLQGRALLCELLRQRQGLFQVLLPLRYLKKRTKTKMSLTGTQRFTVNISFNPTR